MKTVTSWLKINRTLGLLILTTVALCALATLGASTSKTRAAKSTAASGKTATGKTTPTIPSAGRRVLLVTAANSDWVAEVQGKLVGTGRFSVVDTFDAGSATPTLAQLQAYDSVLVWSDGTFADSVATGNVLADYVDDGGGVVVAVFTIASVRVNGRFATDDYYLLEPQSQSEGSELTLGTVYEPTSPLMSGVNSFDGGTSSFHGTGSPNLNAVRVADWSDGEPLIIRRTIYWKRPGDLHFFPPSAGSRDDFWVASTDGATIMANALDFVGGACTPAPSGLVSWWPGDNEANDVTGTNDGTVNGSTFALGEVNQAFSFDGSGAFVSVNDSQSLRFNAATGFTFDFWINPSRIGGTDSGF